MRNGVAAAVLALLLSIPLFAAERQACDLATVVKGFYCETDDQILMQADLVSEVTYHECTECGESTRTKGDCAECDEPTEEKKSGKNVCATCLANPDPVEICEKDAFSCPECEDEHAAAGKCADCEVALVAGKSRALVEYGCSECGETTYRPGKCTDEECKRFKHPLTRQCSSSGTGPHTAKRSK